MFWADEELWEPPMDTSAVWTPHGMVVVGGLLHDGQVNFCNLIDTIQVHQPDIPYVLTTDPSNFIAFPPSLAPGVPPGVPAGTSAVWANGLVHVFGGYNGAAGCPMPNMNGGSLAVNHARACSNEVSVFDPTGPTWTRRVAALPHSVAYTSAVQDPNSGLVSIFGGIDCDTWTASDDIVVYDPATMSSSFHSSPLAGGARYGTSAVWIDGSVPRGYHPLCVNGCAAIFGGRLASGADSDDVIIFGPGINNV